MGRGIISCYPTLYKANTQSSGSVIKKESTRRLSVMKWKIDAEDSCSSLQSNSGDDEEEKEDQHADELRPQSEDHGHGGGSLGRDLGKAGLEEDRSSGFQQVLRNQIFLQFANWSSCSILFPLRGWLHFPVLANHWCLAPLISRISETHLAGSKLKLGNSAAHKFELQTLVAPRQNMIFYFGFMGLEYFAQRLIISLLTNMTKKNFNPRGTFLGKKGL